MVRRIRNACFIILALTSLAQPLAAPRDACLAYFGGNSPQGGTSAQAMSACDANGSSGCEEYCWNDFGTGEIAPHYGCITASNTGGTWYSYGNCQCACPI